MPAWLDSSGHLINAAGDRIDDQNRVTKPRGQPGKGYTRRREEAAERDRIQREYIEMQRTLLQQYADAAVANTQPPAKAQPAAKNYQRPPAAAQPAASNYQQPPAAAQPAASSSHPPPVAKAKSNNIYYDNSVTFGDRHNPELDRYLRTNPEHDRYLRNLGWPYDNGRK